MYHLRWIPSLRSRLGAGPRLWPPEESAQGGSSPVAMARKHPDSSDQWAGAGQNWSGSTVPAPTANRAPDGTCCYGNHCR